MVLRAAIAILITSAGPATGWATDAPAPASAEANPADRPPPKIVRYARRLLARYDADGSGRLNPAECGLIQGRPAVMDRDQDGQISLMEIARHVHEYGRYRRLGQTGLISPAPSNPGQETADAADTLVTTIDQNDPTGPVAAAAEKSGDEHPDAPYYVPPKLRPSNLPSWFTPRDRNGDGQLSLSEFAPTRSREAVKSFELLDTNRDSLLTPQEAAGSTQPKEPTTEPAGGAE